MSKINTVINFGTAQLRQICEELKGKPFPNWWQIEDMQGFGIHITEGDLNLRLMTVIYPVDEAGPGNFLVKIQTAFMGKDVPAESGGYHLLLRLSVPVLNWMLQSLPVINKSCRTGSCNGLAKKQRTFCVRCSNKLCNRLRAIYLTNTGTCII